MAKRNKEEDVLTSDEYTYKKSHGCLKAFIICLVIFVLLIGGIFGGVYFAWGKVVEPRTDLTFVEGVQILSSLYGAKEEDIITKSYDAELDKLKFYDGFKENLYLDKNTDLDISDIMNIAAPGTSSGDPNVDNIPTSGTVKLAGPIDPKVVTVPTSTGNSDLDAILDKIHFDFSSLKDYTGSESEKKILHIKDTEFAAVLNEAFAYLGTDEAASKIPQLAQYRPYFEHIHIGQVLIDSTAKGTAETTRLQIVLKIDAKDMVGTVIESTGLPSFVQSMIKMILPKKLFVGMNVYPNQKDAEAVVVLNSLEEDLAVKLMNAVGMLSGKTGENSIMNVINDKVCDIIQKVNTKIPLYFEDSNCDIEPIEGLMRLLKVDITEAQFLGMIRDIKLPKPEEIKLLLGKVETTVNTILDEKLRTTAVDNFIGSFTNKIAFDNKDADGNPIITADNVFEKISMLTKDETMLQKIDFSKLDYTPAGEPYDEGKYKIEAEYMAVAGLINSSINKPAPGPTPEAAENVAESIGEAPAKKKIPVKILTFNYIPNGDMIQVMAALEITKFVEESLQGKDNSEIMIKFAKEFLPEAIYFKIGLSQDENAGIPPVIELNKLNAKETSDLLDVIGKLAVSLGAGGQDFDVTKLANELEKAVRDNLAKINDTLGSEIQFTEDKGCLIPSIFEIVSGLKMFRDETTNEKTLTSQEVHNIFRDSYTYVPTQGNTAPNAHNTSTEIQSKFFMNDIPEDETLFEEIAKLKGTFAEKLDVDRMVKTEGPTKTLAQLKPEIPEGELGFLINGTGKLKTIVDQLKDTHIIRTNITKNGEDPTILEIEIEGTLNLTGDNAKYAAILPQRLNVKVRTNADKLIENSKKPAPVVNPDAPAPIVESYTKFQFQDMDEATMKAFTHMIEVISKKPFDLAAMEIKIQENLEKTLREIMVGKSAEASQNRINILFVAQEGIKPGFLKIDTTIYDIAAGEVFKDKPEEEKVTAAQLKDNLEKAHNIPTVVNNLAKDSAPGANDALSRVELEEIKGKYYVDVTGQVGTLIDKIKGIKNNYFDTIDGVAMAADDRTIDELALNIKSGEFGNILADKVKVNIKGMKNLSMQRVEILNATQLKIVYTGEIDKGSSAEPTPTPEEPTPKATVEPDAGKPNESLYDKMLPSSVTIEILIDKDLVLALKEGVDVPVNTIQAKINEIDNLDEFSKIFSAITKKPLNVKEANDKAARDVQKVFIELKNDVDLAFLGPDATNPQGSVKIGNIFELAFRQIYTEKVPVANTEPQEFEKVYNPPKDLSAADLRSALKNLFNGGVPSIGATAGTAMAKGQTSFDKVTTTQGSASNKYNLSTTIHSVITDANIFDKLNEKDKITEAPKFDINAAFNTTTSKIKQVTFLSKDCTDLNMKAAYGNIFRDKDETEPIYKNSLILTISVNAREMLKKSNAKLLPENPIDITMVLMFPEKDLDKPEIMKPYSTAIQINTMNKREAQVMQDMFSKHKGAEGGMNSEKMDKVMTDLLATELVKVTVPNIPIKPLTLEDILNLIGSGEGSKVVNGSKSTNESVTGEYYGFLQIDKVETANDVELTIPQVG